MKEMGNGTNERPVSRAAAPVRLGTQTPDSGWLHGVDGRRSSRVWSEDFFRASQERSALVLGVHGGGRILKQDVWMGLQCQ